MTNIGVGLNIKGNVMITEILAFLIPTILTKLTRLTAHTKGEEHKKIVSTILSLRRTAAERHIVPANLYRNRQLIQPLIFIKIYIEVAILSISNATLS